MHDFPHAFDPSRYSDHYLLSRLPEEKVQADVLEALHALGITAWGIDVGGKNVRGRAWGALRRAGVDNPAQLLRARHAGATDGVQGFADIVGILPGGRALLIECKAPRWLGPGARIGRLITLRREGEASPEQLRFLAQAHAMNAVVGVVWSAGDAIEIARKGLCVCT